MRKPAQTNTNTVCFFSSSLRNATRIIGANSPRLISIFQVVERSPDGVNTHYNEDATEENLVAGEIEKPSINRIVESWPNVDQNTPKDQRYTQ